MPAGPVVLNNTPLVALAVLGRLDLLRDLFGEVLIPDSVQNEFLAVDTALRREALANAPWVRVVSLADPRRVLPYFGLDLGESRSWHWPKSAQPASW
jgi:predicted nucleic acid-binding protein